MHGNMDHVRGTTLSTFWQFLRLVSILLPLAAFATGIVLTTYMAENVHYATTHNGVERVKAYVWFHNVFYKRLDITPFEMSYDNRDPNVNNMDRVGAMLATGVLSISMSATVIALLIKRRLVPNLLILAFDLILFLITMSVFIYSQKAYQNEFIPWSEMFHTYYDKNKNGERWLYPAETYDSIGWTCAVHHKLAGNDVDWHLLKYLCDMGHRSYWLILGICIGEAFLLPIHALFWHRARKVPKELEPEDKAELIEEK